MLKVPSGEFLIPVIPTGVCASNDVLGDPMLPNTARAMLDAHELVERAKKRYLFYIFVFDAVQKRRERPTTSSLGGRAFSSKNSNFRTARSSRYKDS